MRHINCELAPIGRVGVYCSFHKNAHDRVSQLHRIRAEDNYLMNILFFIPLAMEDKCR